MKYKYKSHIVIFGIFLSNIPFALASTGQQLAMQGNGKGAPACVSCHGAHGEGNATANYPRLAGQNAEYLRAQIKRFQSGERENVVMAPIAKALSSSEANAVTTYFANLHSEQQHATVTKAANEIGEKLATVGSWSDRHVPACVRCHGPGGSGIGSVFPAIAGQPAGYIRQQLTAFQQGKRRGDPDQLMQSVAKRLTEKEITAVADYFAASPLQTGVNNSSKIVTVSTPPGQDAKGHAYFAPPAHGVYPDGPFGEAVRNGEAIFNETNSNAISGSFVGNDQQCANCHLDGGRLADSAPMWAAWVSYPAYRKKNHKVNDIVMRVQGCFTYSMNAPASKMGHAPAADSETITDVISYMYWLSKGAPTGDTKMAGRGYPKLKDTAEGFDPARGQKVYAANCAVCHGSKGEGVIRDKITLFPPLWGMRAYNWGAGMHKISNAAAFIKANMPLGRGGLLTDQQAWDVAAFINSHHRPQDPRFKGNLEQTTKELHKSKYDYYGKRKGVDGRMLGDAAQQ